jgi:hypothetical protein
MNPWESLNYKPWQFQVPDSEDTIEGNEMNFSAKSAYLKGVVHALMFVRATGLCRDVFIKAQPYLKKLDSLE